MKSQGFRGHLTFHFFAKPLHVFLFILVYFTWFFFFFSLYFGAFFQPVRNEVCGMKSPVWISLMQMVYFIYSLLESCITLWISHRCMYTLECDCTRSFTQAGSTRTLSCHLCLVHSCSHSHTNTYTNAHTYMHPTYPYPAHTHTHMLSCSASNTHTHTHTTQCSQFYLWILEIHACSWQDIFWMTIFWSKARKETAVN